jgi:hypothetical protein
VRTAQRYLAAPIQLQHDTKTTGSPSDFFMNTIPEFLPSSRARTLVPVGPQNLLIQRIASKRTLGRAPPAVHHRLIRENWWSNTSALRVLPCVRRFVDTTAHQTSASGPCTTYLVVGVRVRTTVELAIELAEPTRARSVLLGEGTCGGHVPQARCLLLPEHSERLVVPLRSLTPYLTSEI